MTIIPTKNTINYVCYYYITLITLDFFYILSVFDLVEIDQPEIILIAKNTNKSVCYYFITLSTLDFIFISDAIFSRVAILSFLSSLVTIAFHPYNIKL